MVNGMVLSICHVSMTLNSFAATELPQITFETSKLSVNEDVNEPVIVCIQLVNGYLMEAAASVDLITQEGSATGMCMYSGNTL